ncbi:MAG: histidine kinase [Eubacterium sp.]|nr:histidine kinase [Eubacterium sp.]
MNTEVSNTINSFIVIVSVILAITILIVSMRMRNHSWRMSWFIASLCVAMGGLRLQLTPLNIFNHSDPEGYMTSSQRALSFYSVVAPLFCLYFIESEGEGRGKWDKAFWIFIQGTLSVLITILLVFKGIGYLPYFIFLVQYIILITMLMLSDKDIKECLGFIIGMCFPMAAALIGMTKYHLDFMGFGIVMLLLIVFFGYQVDVESELLKNRAELSENKLVVMMDQIHPHFIYNSLQQIALLCNQDPDRVKPAILTFSGYLRKNFESLTDTGMITFEMEMEHVDMFIALAQILPSRHFEVEKRFEVTDFSIPALTVQPLVENAIKYGIGMSTEGSKLLIETKEENGFYLIKVVDDGHGGSTELPEQKKKKSIGTANVKTRLKVLCDGTFTINKLAQGTEAIIKIPAARAKTSTLKKGEE